MWVQERARQVHRRKIHRELLRHNPLLRKSSNPKPPGAAEVSLHSACSYSLPGTVSAVRERKNTTRSTALTRI